MTAYMCVCMYGQASVQAQKQIHSFCLTIMSWMYRMHPSLWYELEATPFMYASLSHPQLLGNCNCWLIACDIYICITYVKMLSTRSGPRKWQLGWPKVSSRILLFLSCNQEHMCQGGTCEAKLPWDHVDGQLPPWLDISKQEMCGVHMVWRHNIAWTSCPVPHHFAWARCIMTSPIAGC